MVVVSTSPYFSNFIFKLGGINLSSKRLSPPLAAQPAAGSLIPPPTGSSRAVPRSRSSPPSIAAHTSQTLEFLAFPKGQLQKNWIQNKEAKLKSTTSVLSNLGRYTKCKNLNLLGFKVI